MNTFKTATITVQYANRPGEGKKEAKIVTYQGDTYGVWMDKFGLFQPGRTYDIEYAERQFEGKTYRTIKAAKPAQASVGSPAPHAGNGSAGHSERRQIFVQGIAQAAITSGRVELTAANLQEFIRVLCVVYDTSPLSGQQEPPQRQH